MIGAPLMETNRSPAWKPAVLAGASGSEDVHVRGGLSTFASVTAITHSETELTVVVGV